MAGRNMFAAMAVADVAVQMGPRNTRRVVTAGIVLGLICLIVLVIIHLPKHSGSSSPKSAAQMRFHNSPAAARIKANTWNLIAGMTRQQVRHLVGAPATVDGSYWTYPPYVVTGEGPTFRSTDTLCFYGNIYEYKTSVVKLWEGGMWQTPPPPRP